MHGSVAHRVGDHLVVAHRRDPLGNLNLVEADYSWATRKLMEIARMRNPNRRLTTPEDVARSIAVLCHPATYWMTGNTIHVDGGENIVG